MHKPKLRGVAKPPPKRKLDPAPARVSNAPTTQRPPLKQGYDRWVPYVFATMISFYVVPCAGGSIAIMLRGLTSMVLAFMWVERIVPRWLWRNLSEQQQHLADASSPDSYATIDPVGQPGNLTALWDRSEVSGQVLSSCLMSIIAVSSFKWCTHGCAARGKLY